MKIAILADGGTGIGAGHQVRCAVLARVLRSRGHEVACHCRGLPGSPHGWTWRGIDAVVHAAESSLTDVAAAAGAVDWLIVDHYGWQIANRPHTAARVLCCADLPTRPAGIAAVRSANASGCDLILDPHPGAHADSHVAPALLGPDHVLLGPAFRRCRHRPDASAPVLLALGASPGPHVMQRIHVLLQEFRQGTAFVLLIGCDPGPLPAHVTIHRGLDPAATAALMASCRSAILSASSVAYEAFAVGLPCVLVQTAANQARLAAGVATLGWAPVFPELGADLLAALNPLPPTCPPRLDGWGAERVADALEGRPRIHLRPATAADAELLFSWANDAETRRQSFSPAPIAWHEHCAWLDRVLADPHRQLWIAVDPAGRPLGQVRGDAQDEGAVLSLGLAPERRGQGLAVPVIAAACRALASAGRAWVDAAIRTGNTASQRAFARAGFRERERHEDRMVCRWEPA